MNANTPLRPAWVLFGPLLSLALALAGCAAGPTEKPAEKPAEKTAEAELLNCGVPTPPTGSHIVKRERCVVSTEESRAEARRQLELMRMEQERQRQNRAPGS